MYLAISRLSTAVIKPIAFRDMSFFTRDPPEATNSDRQLYSSSGDTRLTFGVLLLPLVSSVISLAAATLKLSSATASHVLYTLQVGYSRSEARAPCRFTQTVLTPLPPLAPTYHAVHACRPVPCNRKSLLLRAHNLISF